MFVIDKPTFTRFARAIRAGAATHGIVANHSVFMEAAAAALRFGDANAAIALLKTRPIIVGVPSAPDWVSGFFYLHGPSAIQMASHAFRMFPTQMETARNGERQTVGDSLRVPDLRRLGEGVYAEIWEKDSVFHPDVALSYPSMASAAAGLVFARTGPSASLGAETWQNILATAFLEAVIGPKDQPSAHENAAVLGRHVREIVFDERWRYSWSTVDFCVTEIIRLMSHEQHSLLDQVSALIWFDGQSDKETFDATPYMIAASSDDIRNAAAQGWESYSAVWHVHELYGYENVHRMIRQAMQNNVVFNHKIDPGQAVSWLRVNRPEDYEHVFRDRMIRELPDSFAKSVNWIEEIANASGDDLNFFKERVMFCAEASQGNQLRSALKAKVSSAADMREMADYFADFHAMCNRVGISTKP